MKPSATEAQLAYLRRLMDRKAIHGPQLLVGLNIVDASLLMTRLQQEPDGGRPAERTPAEEAELQRQIKELF